MSRSPPPYQRKIVLRDSTPLIWRRVLVATTTIADRQDIIQIAMGWDDLHQFRQRPTASAAWLGSMRHTRWRGGGPIKQCSG
ncbi:MAG: hypothetical protein H0T53_01920 [Herpetosiphonaceae bacterium]|nr:hypothetical protein [Herpetosiphonaceae bacterium]